MAKKVEPTNVPAICARVRQDMHEAIRQEQAARDDAVREMNRLKYLLSEAGKNVGEMGKEAISFSGIMQAADNIAKFSRLEGQWRCRVVQCELVLASLGE